MTVVMLIDRWLIRRQLVRLARYSLEGRLADRQAPVLLAELAPQLPRDERADAYLELVHAVFMRSSWPCPDTALQVRDALDALTGGAL